MSRLSRTHMVNGEPVVYGLPTPAREACECGGSCPIDRCWDRRHGQRYEPADGHQGDEGEN